MLQDEHSNNRAPSFSMASERQSACALLGPHLEMEHIRYIRYSNYKTFKQYSVALTDFNILVGPNNSGKSTILGSLKILAEALANAFSLPSSVAQAWRLETDSKTEAS